MDQEYAYAADALAVMAKANEIGIALNHTERTVTHIIAAITSIPDAADRFNKLRLNGSTTPLNSERARQAALYLLREAGTRAGQEAQDLSLSRAAHDVILRAQTFAKKRAPAHRRVELADILKVLTETELADDFRHLLLGDVFSSHNSIELRLGQQTVDVRDTARALAGELRAQVEELKRSTPNDSERLVKHNDLVAFFEKMATGLVQLAEALDQAVARATDGKPEPVFLGEAARIARDLHLGLMEWLEVNRTWVVDIPMRMTFYGLGISFLHFIGADSFAAVAGLTALVFRRAPRTKVASKKDSRSKGKAAGRRGNPDST